MNQDEAERARRELIQERAYAIYQARGGQEGLQEDDWLQAEREIDGLPDDDDILPADEEGAEAAGEESIS